MRLAVAVWWLAAHGAQVVVGEDVQVVGQGAGSNWFLCQCQAQSSYLRGTKMIVATGAAQAVIGRNAGVQTQYGKGVQVGAFAKHLSGLRPCAV